MSKELDELRAALMSTNQFAWWQRRQLQWLSPGNEAQRKVVMAALGPDHPLMPRMERCGKVSASNNMFYCGVPLCPRCFMRERGRQTRQNIRVHFAGVPNEQLAFVTVLLPTRSDIFECSDVITREKRRLVNFIDRQRKKDPRWNDFELVGYWEMGRTTHGAFHEAGRNTKLALRDLEFPIVGHDDDTVWLPHLHAIVRKGRLTEKEIAKALRNDGHTAPYQVDVRPFHSYKKAEHNIQNLTRYCLKFRIENDFKLPDPFDFNKSDKEVPGTRDWWPAKDIRDYVNWLRVDRSGFQSLRFVLGGAEDASKQPSPQSIDGSMADGTTISLDRFKSRDHEEAVCKEAKAVMEFDSTHGMSGVYEGSQVSISARVSSVSHVLRNNNLLLDTNWTKVGEVEYTAEEHPVADDCVVNPKPQLSPMLREFVNRWKARNSVIDVGPF
jgi:hypothetical protein